MPKCEVICNTGYYEVFLPQLINTCQLRAIKSTVYRREKDWRNKLNDTLGVNKVNSECRTAC